MRNVNELKLVRLNLTENWTVTYNQLYDIEPSEVIHIKEREPSIWALIFVQDLLQLTNNQDGGLIDVGWYPDGDEEGYYKVELVPKKNDELDWDASVVVFETRSLEALLACIQRLVEKAPNPIS